jgi:hypothetical protein
MGAIRAVAIVAAAWVAMGECRAQSVLDAHLPPWNVSFTPSVAVFFDLEALRDPLVIEGFTTALNRGPGAAFMVEVLIRDGTSLGGTASSGPGYSHDGWTSLGFAYGVQGPVGGGISLPVSIPRFVARPGHITGVALDFYTGGPGCWGGGGYATYQNSDVRLIAGDVRSPSFAPGQFYFPRHQLIGSIFYHVAPCYPNCDGSTVAPVLNVNDFICFQTRFAAGDSWANCDESTEAPVLNVGDFVCFMQRFAGGCE